MSSYRYSIILLLLLVGLLVGTVSAVDGKSGVVWDNKTNIGIFPVSTEEKNIFTEGIIKEALTTKSLSLTVKYEVPKHNGGIVVTLFCRDSVGYYVPEWGGMANGISGFWSFDAKDTLSKRKNIDNCYFTIIDSNKEQSELVKEPVNIEPVGEEPL